MCPVGYEPCSEKTSESETVCWPVGDSKENCPILDIIIISNDFEKGWLEQGYKTTRNSFPPLGSKESISTTKIAFSKLQSRDETEGGQEPIIGSAMNTFIPCFGHNSERLILGGDEMEKAKFSIEKEEPLEICPNVIWRDESEGD